MMRKRKYKVGDIVVIDGEIELFEVSALDIETHHSKYEDDSEVCYITVEGVKSKKVMDSIGENDIDVSPLYSLKDEALLTENELFELLSQYRNYIEIDLFLNSTSVRDNEYELKSHEIMESICSMFGYTTISGA